MTFDPRDLWDFERPAVSEERFRHAVAEATGERALLLRTQLARSLGLQQRFDECAAELDAVALAMTTGANGVSAEVRAYLALERGRQVRSSGQVDACRPYFITALDEAQTAGLDHLAADAAHMLAIIGTEQDQLAWAQRALAIADGSTDRRARLWVGPIANNLGWTLHSMGRLDEALQQFEAALCSFEERGDAERIRVARWTLARGLRSLSRCEEALAIQSEIAVTGPEDGYVEEELGELLLALDRVGEARPHFARAYELLAADTSLAESEPERLDRLRLLSA